MCPILNSLSGIMNRKMKNLHENTVSCYLNPSLLFLMIVIIMIKDEVEFTIDLIHQLEVTDWILLVTIGAVSVWF